VPYVVVVIKTAYGTWLRGDRRGWIEDGRLMPHNPPLEAHDLRALKFPPFTFDRHQWSAVGQWIGDALRTSLARHVVALTVQSWHVHFMVDLRDCDVARIVKCAKDAVRWGLRADRPIWTEGYDNRLCWDETTVRNRIEYVQRHNLSVGLPANPWAFIETPDL